MKALVIMIVRRLYSAYALLRFLEQDDPVPCRLRQLLTAHGRLPSRRTWERRLATLPDTLPGLIGYSGRHLVAVLNPWASQGRAVSVDSRRWPQGAASGIPSTAHAARCPTARLIPKRAGSDRAGMAGGMAGSYTWP